MEPFSGRMRFAVKGDFRRSAKDGGWAWGNVVVRLEFSDFHVFHLRHCWSDLLLPICAHDPTTYVTLVVSGLGNESTAWTTTLLRQISMMRYP